MSTYSTKDILSTILLTNGEHRGLVRESCDWGGPCDWFAVCACGWKGRAHSNYDCSDPTTVIVARAVRDLIEHVGYDVIGDTQTAVEEAMSVLAQAEDDASAARRELANANALLAARLGRATDKQALRLSNTTLSEGNHRGSVTSHATYNQPTTYTARCACGWASDGYDDAERQPEQQSAPARATADLLTHLEFNVRQNILNAFTTAATTAETVEAAATDLRKITLRQQLLLTAIEGETA